MRVAYVSMDSGVPVFGSKGCSIHVQEIMRALIKVGTSIDLFTTGLGGQVPSDLNAIRLHGFSPPAGSDLDDRELHALSQNKQLRETLERTAPFDLVYERYSLWSYEAMEFACAHGVPGLLEVNAPLIDEQVTHRGLANRKQAEIVASHVFGAADALIAVSTEVARYVESFSETRDRIHVIPNGVDVDRFQQRPFPIAGEKATTFTVCFVGTLKPWHGTAVLLEAFDLLHKQRPNTRLLIVGDGPEREKLERNIKNRGLVHATQLTGKVQPHEIPAILAVVDAGAAPYDDREGFYFSPLKIYEYMAAGLPVVASRLGQIAELVSDEETGLLCPPGDAVLLAAALARLQDDASLRARLGRAARACVERDHTWDITLRRILESAGFDSVGRLSRKEVAA